MMVAYPFCILKYDQLIGAKFNGKGSFVGLHNIIIWCLNSSIVLVNIALHEYYNVFVGCTYNY